MSLQEFERAHLQSVYEKLVAERETSKQLIQEKTEQAAYDRKQNAQEIRLNFDNFADSLDTYAAIEMKNREVDQAKHSLQVLERKLAKIDRLLPSPYFGKIELQFPEEKASDSFYFGINGFTDTDRENLIYDWRSPIAELFYNNDFGVSSYEVNGQSMAVTIQKRRQLVTAYEKVKLVFDTTTAIDDPVLLAVLQKEASTTMRDITASIQQEQNKIIRDQNHFALLVNGVAGSGKTSVIMQRIAYLLYRNRQEITADNVLFLSPNSHFSDYVSQVLPSLGERNPKTMTLREFLQSTEKDDTYFERISQPTVTKQTQILRSREFAVFIKAHGNQLLMAEDPLFLPIKFKQKKLISSATILNFYRQTPQKAAFFERIQATKASLLTFWEQVLQQQALRPEIQDQLFLLSEEEQRAYFGKPLAQVTTAVTYQVLKRKYRQVEQAIQKMTWIDPKILLQKLYEKFTGKAFVLNENLDVTVSTLFVQQLFIKKRALPPIRFLIVDEVQDYTAAQIQLLAELFLKAWITMVGDEDQAIFNSHISFAEISTILQDYSVDPKLYRLQKSYRSSGTITQLFSQLGTDPGQIKAVQPLGEAIHYEAFADLRAFKRIVQRFSEKRAVTILTKTPAEAEFLKNEWKYANDQPKILSVSMAKGLEFDHVILFDVSQKNYHSQSDKRILYTAISRAMKTLVITYDKALPVWLSQ